MQSANEVANDVEAPSGNRVRISVFRRRPTVVFALGDGEEPPEDLAGVSHRPKSVRAALRLSTSRQHDVRCVVVSPQFGRGVGLRFIEQLRQQRPLMPILLQVDRAERALLSLAYFQAFEISTGRDHDAKVLRFVERVVERPRTTADQLDEQVAELARDFGLTPSERRIAAAAVRGMSRSDLLASFDVSVNTLKSQIRSILKKTGFHSLNDLCRVVLMNVVSESA